MRRRKPLRRKQGLRYMSPMQRQRIKSYIPIQKEFLSRPENQYCVICIARKRLGEKIRIKKATEVHHMALRAGPLLFDTTYFAASCRGCREWPHENKTMAKKLGLIFNVRRNGFIHIIGEA